MGFRVRGLSFGFRNGPPRAIRPIAMARLGPLARRYPGLTGFRVQGSGSGVWGEGVGFRFREG